MRIELIKKEIEMLKKESIEFSEGKDYTDESALTLVDAVRDAEIFYAQEADIKHSSRMQAIAYGDLADKIQNQIPDD